MNELTNLCPTPGTSNRQRRRVGRGPGSNWGKTAAKGHKGQKARSGGKVRPGFEGGQMTLARRLPKRGFFNLFRKAPAIINVAQLERFEAGATVGVEELIAAGLVPKRNHGVKLLAKGDLDRKLTVRVHKVSAGAKAKIEAAGGTVEVI